MGESAGQAWWTKWWTEPTFLAWAMDHIILAVAGYPEAILRDGSRAMIGDFNVAANKILFQHVLIKAYSTTGLQFRNLADTDYAWIAGKNFVATGVINSQGNGTYVGWLLSQTGMYSNLFRPQTESSDMIFRTGNTGGKVTFQSYDSGFLMLRDVGELNDGAWDISRAGDITLLAGKAFDAYTNAGYMKPRRVSQAAQPTPEAGELLCWRDTDDDKTYLVYEDPDVGTRKVELV